MNIKSSLIKLLININDNYFSKIFIKKRGLQFNKENLYSWMNLTKKERFNLSKKDSMNYLIERKNLLNQIRNEYKNSIEKHQFLIVELYWTSRKTINGLKHFVLINQYKFKNEVYLDFVSVLDDAISFTLSKKVFEESSQWIKGWNNEMENINIQEYLEFKSSIREFKPNKIIFNETSIFNIS